MSGGEASGQGKERMLVTGSSLDLSKKKGVNGKKGGYKSGGDHQEGKVWERLKVNSVTRLIDLYKEI